jgi:D-glycero-D-manno-heptose 1,7-bisphosphate phosphatase
MPVVFLDRDGVINENRDDHVKSWEEFRFIPGALSAIRMLREAGVHVFVVTNQAVIGRGILTHTMLEDIHTRMTVNISAAGGKVHDLRYCPHTPEQACLCRKPQPGMLLDLAARWQVDLGRAYMVGDALTDIEAATSAGCRSILVQTGRGLEQMYAPGFVHCPPNHVAANLFDAVMWILEHESNTLHLDDSVASRRYTAVKCLVAAGK